MSIVLDDGKLSGDGVEITDVTVLKDRQGAAFSKYAVDGEGLAVTSTGNFFLSSEGHVERGIQPRVSEISSDGSVIRDFALPSRYLTRQRGDRGVRHNLAFEGLSLTPDGRWLFAGIENALVQDGPEATLDRRSPSRVVRFDAATGDVIGEYLYWVEPVPRPPAENDGFRVNGLVEILALDGANLLALERAFAQGTGNTVRLFHVDLSAADDIHGKTLAGRTDQVSPARKTLLVDFGDLGIPLDNLEGLCFGPDLANGAKTLILVADNNFSPRQRTQILAFSWSLTPVSIPQIQGAAHRSPLAGTWVRGVEGIVTAVDRHPDRPLAWLQTTTDDGDPKTSEAIALSPREPISFDVGDRLAVSGRIEEFGRDDALTVTRLADATTRLLSSNALLPESTVLGTSLPRNIDNDGLASFDPEEDRIDFLESREGMRVTVPNPIVVGPTSRFGDFVVLAERGEGLPGRTARGGIRLRPDSANPERIQIDPRLVAEKTSDGRKLEFSVGDHFDAAIVGVLDYSFGAYEVVATEPLSSATSDELPADTTTLRGDATHLTIATFNVENLDALDSPEKFGAVAGVIVDGLGSPDVLALQEVQDDNGALDDGQVSAAATLARLSDAVESRGGPRYEAYQIDPANNADGGQPGANIRVAYLVRSGRLQVVPRGQGDSATSARMEVLTDGRIGLSHNPARVAADHPAFARDDAMSYQPTRKPLALELEFNGRQIFLINAHLKSKRGDDGLFGPVQPPVRESEAQRTEQARAINAFVSSILRAAPDAAIVVLGDLNEHEFRPPVAELAGNALVNLIPRVDDRERYTYNFRGNSQVLDHVLISRSLAEDAAPEIDIVHVNADAPATLRASDHDPVVVRLDLKDS